MHWQVKMAVEKCVWAAMIFSVLDFKINSKQFGV